MNINDVRFEWSIDPYTVRHRRDILGSWGRSDYNCSTDSSEQVRYVDRLDELERRIQDIEAKLKLIAPYIDENVDLEALL